eukprot:gene5323-951_t
MMSPMFYPAVLPVDVHDLLYLMPSVTTPDLRPCPRVACRQA